MSPLPVPIVADGVVTSDPVNRVLTVKPAPDATAYERLLWREGHRALREEDASHIGSWAPVVYAHGAGRQEIARGVADDDGSLRFAFPVGNTAYAALVGKPGLRTWIALDRNTSHILRCAFRHRGPRPAAA